MCSNWYETANSHKYRAKTAGQKIACGLCVLASTLRQALWGVPLDGKEGARIMVNINTFSGVGVAGMSWSLHVAGATPAAAHSAAAYAATGAQIILPPKHLHAAATAASVNRGTI